MKSLVFGPLSLFVAMAASPFSVLKADGFLIQSTNNPVVRHQDQAAQKTKNRNFASLPTSFLSQSVVGINKKSLNGVNHCQMISPTDSAIVDDTTMNDTTMNQKEDENEELPSATALYFTKIRKDLEVLNAKIQKCLDINGDGKVDAKDVKAALSIGLLASALVICPLPSHAKGGGDYGGGDGGYSGNDYSSRPRYYRSQGHGSGDNISHSKETSCNDFPDVGETVELPKVFGKNTKATVTETKESECQFTVVPLDGGDAMTIDSGKKEEIDVVGDLIFYFTFGAILINDKLWYKRILVDHDRAISEFQDCPDPNSIDDCIPPQCGTYCGSSTERSSDDDEKIYQSVKTNLVFKINGSISGSGNDSGDGDYNVFGKWRPLREGGYILSWTETYSSYDVKVMAKMKNYGSKTKIKGTFVSSLNVSGEFDIRLE